MIREKSLLRKQICVAINLNDYETARKLMDTLCEDNKPLRKRWYDEDVEYLMRHVEEHGYQKAIRIVAEKLGRKKLNVKGKYDREMRKRAKNNVRTRKL